MLPYVALQSTAHLCGECHARLGCRSTNLPGAHSKTWRLPDQRRWFLCETTRLVVDNEEFAKPCLVTVQALAFMPVRDAGCGGEAKGWVYSSMSFLMAQDIGFNLEATETGREYMQQMRLTPERLPAGDASSSIKCWSNLLGRLPQLPEAYCSVSKFDVSLADEVSWSR